jgi:hypothetical protein
MFGSYESWGLNQSLCADRYSRYSAYGFLPDREKAKIQHWNGTFGSNEAAEIDWEMVDWASLQQECLQRNSLRFRVAEPSERRIIALSKSLDSDSENSSKSKPANDTRIVAQSRTAVILRSWIGMKYTENDLYHIRSIIMELSLYSGSEYEVILLVDCQEETLPAEDDLKAWKSFEEDHLPQELRGLAVFFNTQMLSDWYPDIDVHAYVALVKLVCISDVYQGNIAVLSAYADFLSITSPIRLYMAIRNGLAVYRPYV